MGDSGERFVWEKLVGDLYGRFIWEKFVWEKLVRDLYGRFIWEILYGSPFPPAGIPASRKVPLAALIITLQR